MAEDTTTQSNVRAHAADLLALTERLRELADEEDPFGNPILATALAISGRLESGSLGEEEFQALVTFLRDEAFEDRAGRLASYVGGVNATENAEAFAETAQRLLRPDPSDSPVRLETFKSAIETTRFAAVFTAHPTFSLSAETFRALAETASGRGAPESLATHRPKPPTLEDEFTQAVAAIRNGRDAIDRFNAALLDAASPIWPDRWSELQPRSIVLASWVGYDTDGRTDIDWWDTLRLRLRMKRLQIDRLAGQMAGISSAGALAERLERALAAIDRQIEACPDAADPDATAAFAAELIDGRDDALRTPEPLLPLFADAIAAAPPEDKIRLCVARAGLVSHSMSLAHSHVRLNASQVHNATRLRLGFEEPPADPFRRRVLLSSINSALDEVEPLPVDFGAILAEQASAARLMMLIAQIAKHVDGTAPVRFLIAETESGYTLLSTLWLARLFGVEEHIEISPLFETAEALEHGSRVLEEALRSPHYRDYLRKTGRLALQFGYSDSGRYVGQLTATFLIERLRLKLVDLLARYELTDVEVILFDTHGESIGRGAHPGSLADRLTYLSPVASRQAFAEAGIAWRDESAFQGGEGYLLFGTPELATASVARIAEHVFEPLPSEPDPIYEEADFTADFFASIGAHMRELVEDAGYASLLGAFGPALLDRTGSRPVARQTDAMAGAAVIRHPRELRAIPNNAILQQLGWLANTVHGVGAAAARQPELFEELRRRSPRFRRSLDFVRHALAHSDLDVLRAVVGLLDPGSWLDRATHSHDQKRVQALVSVSRALDRLDLWVEAQAMFRRIQTDHVLLRSAWPEAPRMQTREMLLHALRIAIIQRIWLTAMQIPDFSPRHGLTHETLELRLLQLDVPAALEHLAEVFPDIPDPAAGHYFGEPHGPRGPVSYAREHALLFAPMGRMFELVREIGTAVSHEVGAFG